MGANSSAHMIRAPLPLPMAVKKACKVEFQSQKLLLEYMLEISPINSVADFGTGYGAWIKEALAQGITNVKAFDIPEIPVEDRYFPNQYFQEADLSKAIKNEKEEKFDLVISTEVAEHIEDTYSQIFVDNLIKFGDLILFSAALPYQGGANHVNENWVEYWSKKFAIHGFGCFDIIRHRFWLNPGIASYYRQNCLVFARGDVQEKLKEKGFLHTITPRSYIHPEMYLKIVNQARPPVENELERDISIYYSNTHFFNNHDDYTHHNYGKDDISHKAITQKAFDKVNSGKNSDNRDNQKPLNGYISRLLNCIKR